MNKKLLLAMAIILLGCEGHNKSDSVSTTWNAPPSENPAAKAYAGDLVSQDYNKFLIQVRNSVERFHNAILPLELAEVENVVATFEQNVAEARSPTQQQLVDLQNEGVEVQAKVNVSSYIDLKRAAAIEQYPQQLNMAYKNLERLCDQGRYGNPDDVTKRGFIHEQVKAYYSSICKSGLGTVRVVTDPFPEKLNNAQIEQIHEIEAKWPTFRTKNEFTSNELTEMVNYAIGLPLSLEKEAGEVQMKLAILKHRLTAAQSTVTDLINQYRHDHGKH